MTVTHFPNVVRSKLNSPNFFIPISNWKFLSITRFNLLLRI